MIRQNTGKLIWKIYSPHLENRPMYWEEDEQNNQPKSSKSIVDISFKFNDNGTAIAADHAYDLFQAVLKKFPEIEKIDNLAIHSLYGAESGAKYSEASTPCSLSNAMNFFCISSNFFILSCFSLLIIKSTLCFF